MPRYIVTVEVKNGEYEYIRKSLTTSPDATQALMDGLANQYFGNLEEDAKDDSELMQEWQDGQIFDGEHQYTVQGAQQLSESDFAILIKYI